MQVADLHLSTGLEAAVTWNQSRVTTSTVRQTSNARFRRKTFGRRKPDLVVLTGDQVNGGSAPDLRGKSHCAHCPENLTRLVQAVFKFAEPMVRRGIPYAAIFGNHDDEDSSSLALE